MPILDNVRFVLIETSHPGNIGGAARALHTMGIGQLVLVKPLRYPDPQAEWRAAGGTEVLRRARVVETFDEAVAECSLVFCASGRERRIPWPAMDAAVAADQLAALAAKRQVAVVFGREANGLNNDELRRCQAHLYIDANPDYGSLNLAMAVQVVAYEIRRAAMRAGDIERGDEVWDRLPASHADIESFVDHLQRVLCEIEFLDADNPGQTMTRLRRLFARIRPDDTEVKMLRGVLTEIERKLASNASSAGTPNSGPN